jgi:hypothetical protein
VILPCTPYSTPDAMRGCEPFDDEETYSDDALEDALEIASRVMYLATGRQFHGTCTETNLRPCGCSSCGMSQDMGWGIIRWPGAFDCGGACRGGCSCSRVHAVELGIEPLATVAEVRIDGVVLALSSYRVDDWKWLVRTDGEGWPRCQDMSVADDAVGSWTVDLTWGLPPSPLVVRGTEVLAGEIVKACVGAACGLRHRSIQAINRAGVQVTMIDPAEFLEGGKTGIAEADWAIKFENPGGISVGARFYNPDDFVDRARRVGTGT